MKNVVWWVELFSVMTFPPPPKITFRRFFQPFPPHVLAAFRLNNTCMWSGLIFISVLCSLSLFAGRAVLHQRPHAQRWKKVTDRTLNATDFEISRCILLSFLSFLFNFLGHWLVPTWTMCLDTLTLCAATYAFPLPLCFVFPFWHKQPFYLLFYWNPCENLTYSKHHISPHCCYPAEF